MAKRMQRIEQVRGRERKVEREREGESIKEMVKSLAKYEI